MRRVVYTVNLFVVALAAAAHAEILVQPRQATGMPGTIRNPYVVYDRGVPTAQVNTPQLGTVPPGQPLLTTPLGQPLGTNYGDPFGGRGVLGRD